METPPSFYPGFEHAAHELDQFIVVLDLFTIILASGDIIKYEPDDTDHFRKWLEVNNVTDIRKQPGWVTQ